MEKTATMYVTESNAGRGILFFYDGEWYYSSDNTKYSTVTEGKEK